MPFRLCHLYSHCIHIINYINSMAKLMNFIKINNRTVY